MDLKSDPLCAEAVGIEEWLVWRVRAGKDNDFASATGVPELECTVTDGDLGEGVQKKCADDLLVASMVARLFRAERKIDMARHHAVAASPDIGDLWAR